MSLLHQTRPDAPHLDRLTPRAAIPGGSLEVFGAHLLQPSTGEATHLPYATFGDTEASLDLGRETRAQVRVPTGAISSNLVLHRDGLSSNTLHANVGVPMAEELHLVSNPAVDKDNNLFAMVSGPRGDRVPVSIFRIDRDLQVRPFARDILNVSALAFDPEGYLYASSRAEGAVYRISPQGAVSTFAEGMGIATGIAFDAGGNLFVGDRSGTIFKVGPSGSKASGEVFVFATLEPSVAAYHLAFRDDGTLLVTAPTTSSNQSIYAIDPDGNTTVYYRGLGRPQGMALDADDNLYVAASLHGQRGIVKIGNAKSHDARSSDAKPGTSKNGEATNDPTPHAELLVSGNDLIGLCFLEDGCAALATNTTLFHIDLGIHGRSLF